MADDGLREEETPQQDSESAFVLDDLPEELPKVMEVESKKRSKLLWGLLVIPAAAVIVGVLLALGAFSSPQKARRKIVVVAPTKVVKPTKVAVVPWYLRAGANFIPSRAHVPTYAVKSAPRDFASLTKASSPQAREATKILGSTNLDRGIRANIQPEVTDNPKDRYIKLRKGTLPNPNYSYWTESTFATETTDIAERLLNPIYGDWAAYQSEGSDPSKNFPIQKFKSYMTSAYYNSLVNSSNKSSFPVYADWSNDNYGISDLVPEGGVPKWFGTITNASGKWYYRPKTINYKVVATYQVKFTALTTRRTTLTRHGVLTIKWVAGRTLSPALPKVLMASASLAVTP